MFGNDGDENKQKRERGEGARERDKINVGQMKNET